jgi:glycosyltransferase involved in cell wall biosynthesis
MNLLVVAPVFPDSPADGDRLRLFHWLRHLGQKHRVHLVCFADPARRADWGVSTLGSALKSVYRITRTRIQTRQAAAWGLLSGLPVNVGSAASAAMAAQVDDLLPGMDAVLAYRLKMAPYALRFKGPRYLDYTDSMTRYTERRVAQAALEGRGLAKRWLRRQARQLAAYETWVAGQFDGLFVNAATDAQALRAMAPRHAGRIHVAANGVRLDWRQPRPDGPKLLFVGHLAYPPNAEAVLWFAKRVLPLILIEEPRATFEIVGGDAPSAILALAGQPGIRLHGFRNDMRPYVESAAVSVCPVHSGAGRQNKLMEAFAAGLPAVATQLAADGAEALPGKHLLAADSPADFAAAVLMLLRDPALGRRLAKEAGRLVKSKYDWARNSAGLEAVLRGKKK